MLFARSLEAFTDEELIDLQIALGEGVANAIEHGFSRDGFFDVRCYVVDAVLTVEIEDSGKGAPLSEIGVPQGRSEPNRGLGVNIIRLAADAAQFIRLDTGMLLRISKRMSRRRAKSGLVENLRTP